ncbi:MAG: beta strand repeat-containing protein, partial [Prochlorotrichaceae cyanobacterium]
TTGTINFTGNTTLGSPTTIIGNTINLDSGAALNSGINNLTFNATQNIVLNGSSSITATSGNLSLNANTTGTSTGTFYGILVNGATITTNSGAVNLTGISGDTGSGNYGIYQINNSQVTTTTGTITYTGTGKGDFQGDNDGIRTEGAGTVIRSQDGNIFLTGISQSTSGGLNDGVLIHLSSTVDTTGSGSIEIVGTTSGVGGDTDRGVVATEGTTIRTGTGNISLTGSSAVAGTTNLQLTSTTNLGSATTGNVSLIGDTQVLGTLVPQGIGTFTIAPSTAGANLTANLTSVPASFSSFTVGSATTGTVNITGGATLEASTTILGTTIDLASGAALNTGLNDLTLTASRNILLNSGSSITSSSGNITLTANSAGNVVGDFSGIELNNADLITTSGQIILDGTGGLDTGTIQDNHGVYLQSGAQILSTGTGTVGGISLTGRGGDAFSNNHGIYLLGAGTLVSAVDGSIQLTGTGGTALSGSNHGILVQNSAAITSTGTGAIAATINLTGTGGAGQSFNRGVYMFDSATITSQDGDITFAGTGGAGGGAAMGILLNSGTQVRSTGTGTEAANITLIGVGGTGTGSGNQGVNIGGTGTTISTVAGDVLVRGTGAAGDSGSYQGILLDSGTTIASTGTGANAGTLTFEGFAGSGGADNQGFYIGSNSSSITTVDGDISISGTGGSGFQTTHHGIQIFNNPRIAATGLADITLIGQPPSNPALGKGIAITNGLTLGAANGAVITLNGEILETTTVIPIVPLTTLAGAYDLNLLGGGTFNNGVTFNNTGTLRINGSPTDVLTFGNGFATTGITEVQGTIALTAGTIELGDLVLQGNTTLNFGTNDFNFSNDITPNNFDWTVNAQNITLGTSFDMGTGNLNLKANRRLVISNNTIDSTSGTITL